MRAGELFGLKWDCVDLVTGNIVIKRSVSRSTLTETTKTKSQRIVPINPLVIEILQEHRRQMLSKQVPGFESGLVFPSEKGKPRTANTLDKAFDQLATVLNTDVRIGAQVLRRSMNTNLLKHAVDRLTIRSIMGHTSEAMTARYSHSSDAEKRAAVLTLPGGRRATTAENG